MFDRLVLSDINSPISLAHFEHFRTHQRRHCDLTKKGFWASSFWCLRLHPQAEVQKLSQNFGYIFSDISFAQAYSFLRSVCPSTKMYSTCKIMYLITHIERFLFDELSYVLLSAKLTKFPIKAETLLGRGPTSQTRRLSDSILQQSNNQVQS